jgi:tetratricopeptide (TPR) repeat protein
MKETAKENFPDMAPGPSTATTSIPPDTVPPPPSCTNTKIAAPPKEGLSLGQIGRHPITVPSGSGPWTEIDDHSSTGAAEIQINPRLYRWAMVDVPGSPKLTRLFAALQMDALADISPLSLPPPSTIFGTSVAPQFLSNADLVKLCTSENEERSMNEPRSANKPKPKGLKLFPSNKAQEVNEALSITDLDGSTIAPFGITVLASPFNEIYPFPTSPSATIRSVPPCRTYFSTYQIREIECNERLAKLRRLCPRNHPGIITTMKDLAHAYRFQGKLRPAEHWYKQVLIASENIAGARTLETLPFWLNLLDVITNQGRYKLAKDMHRQIHAKILEYVKPEHELAMRSLLIMGATEGFMGNFQEEEAIYRQLVQMRLNILGPKHRDTVAAIARLAIPMRDLGRHEESEKLLRTAMQLYHNVPGMPEDGTCRRMRNLAMLLGKQKRYEESRKLFQLSAERSAVSLGENHPGTLASYYGIGKILRREGHIIESEKVLQETLIKQLKVFGENHPSSMNTMFELAENLMELNNYKEATTWHEMSLRGRLEIFGTESKLTLLSCEHLGRCYNAQGRYSDALALYQQTIANIRSTKGDDYPSIAEIQDWIDSLLDLGDGGETDSEELEEG